MSDEMSFSLDWLAEASGKKPQLSTCPDGHLVVNENTHWKPERFNETGRSLVCQVVEHEEAS